jgi:ArsR family transcriptional regulator
MNRQNPKQKLFAQFAAVAKTLGHAHRLELLEQVAQGERSVDILAQRTGLSIANASQHLQHLRRAGLVTARREGKFAYYQLADDAVLDLVAALHRIAERNVAEVGRVLHSYFHDRDSLEPVSREELLRRSRAGEVTILDVRPEDEFALGHLPGAVNIPLRALQTRLSELNRVGVLGAGQLLQVFALAQGRGRPAMPGRDSAHAVQLRPGRGIAARSHARLTHPPHEGRPRQ